MESSARIRSELPGGDPALLNKVAWSRRWSDRQGSADNARMARKTAKEGSGNRSRIQQGMALRTLAWQARWRGQLDEAMGYCLSAETFLPESDHAEERACIYATLSSIHFARNRFDLATCSVDRGFFLLREYPEEDVTEVMTELLLTRATIQRHTGERARAGITLGRAQELADPESMPGVDYCTAVWLLSDGDADAARLRGVSAMEVANARGNRLLLPYLHGLLGACDTQLGRVKEAVEHLEKGLEIAETDQDDRVRGFLHRYRAQLETDRGDLKAAKQHLEAAARLAKQQNHAFERKRVALVLAELFERQGDYRKAVEQHKLAWRLQNETRMN